jgi:hypothetical protein
MDELCFLGLGRSTVSRRPQPRWKWNTLSRKESETCAKGHGGEEDPGIVNLGDHFQPYGKLALANFQRF